MTIVIYEKCAEISRGSTDPWADSISSRVFKK